MHAVILRRVHACHAPASLAGIFSHPLAVACSPLPPVPRCPCLSQFPASRLLLRFCGTGFAFVLSRLIKAVIRCRIEEQTTRNSTRKSMAVDAHVHSWRQSHLVSVTSHPAVKTRTSTVLMPITAHTANMASSCSNVCVIVLRCRTGSSCFCPSSPRCSSLS